MQKLYLKIVVAIWVVMILSAAVAVLLLRLYPGTTAPGDRGSKPPMAMLSDIIESGHRLTEGRGEAAFVDWFRGNPLFADRLYLRILRADGTVVYESMSRDGSTTVAPESIFADPIIVARESGDYTIRVAPGAIADRFDGVTSVQRSIARAAFNPQLLWWLLLVAVPLTIVLSIAVARYLVSPLRVFERAGRQLALGKLHVRVLPHLGQRSDEIAEFASTFDHMASKIEGLVQAHQRLLRDVSHELRAPLARVLAAASLARKASGDDAASEFDRIDTEVGRLDRMISRLLSYARLDSGEARVTPSVLRLDRLLQTIVDDARIEADHERRRIEVIIGAPCRIFADSQLLRSGIENVLRNAIRHTPEGGSVIVELQASESDCELTVRDHGPGVADEDLPHLFEPFFRTPTSRIPGPGGYGIGLAIARKSIELHAGTISADNAREGGLRVRISLPLHN